MANASGSMHSPVSTPARLSLPGQLQTVSGRPLPCLHASAWQLHTLRHHLLHARQAATGAAAGRRWRVLAMSAAATKKRTAQRKKPAPPARTGKTQLKDELGRPRLPTPGVFQQTVRRSFQVPGIGLHSGKYVMVRVRPAYAFEGRYFVKVPEGTNSRLLGEQPEPEPLTPDELEAEDKRVELLLEFVEGQAGGDIPEDANWQLWARERAQETNDPALLSMFAPGRDTTSAEQPEPRDPEETYIVAHISNVVLENPRWTTLQQTARAADEEEAGSSSSSGSSGSASSDWEPWRLRGVEHLLSALEAMGVDNARIEVEGADELPHLDGSAVDWARELHKAGLLLAGDYEGDIVRRLVLRPPGVVSVAGEGGAHITLYPQPATMGAHTRLTAGLVGPPEAPVIGKQWLEWSPWDDMHYRWALAPARTTFASEEELWELRRSGLARGYVVKSALVAEGQAWEDPRLVRFPGDEPVRHALVDLIGDLALLSVQGHAGLPLAHVVAYRADHALAARFADAVWQACQQDMEEHYYPAVNQAMWRREYENLRRRSAAASKREAEARAAGYSEAAAAAAALREDEEEDIPPLDELDSLVGGSDEDDDVASASGSEGEDELGDEDADALDVDVIRGD